MKKRLQFSNCPQDCSAIVSRIEHVTCYYCLICVACVQMPPISFVAFGDDSTQARSAYKTFGLKTGIDFDHYGLKSGMVSKGTIGANNLFVFSTPNEW